MFVDFDDEFISEESEEFNRLYAKLSENERKHLKLLMSVEIEKLRISNDSSLKNIKKLDEEQRRTRRACKAGVFKKNITIHFSIDKIDIKQVFDRDYSLLISEKKIKRKRKSTVFMIYTLLQNCDSSTKIGIN